MAKRNELVAGCKLQSAGREVNGCPLLVNCYGWYAHA